MYRSVRDAPERSREAGALVRRPGRARTVPRRPTMHAHDRRRPANDRSGSRDQVAFRRRDKIEQAALVARAMEQD